MAEQTSPEPAPPAAKRSWKLAVVVTFLAILPPILPWPLWGLAHQWIGPLDAAAWEQCRTFYCPAAAHWETLETLLIFGPSLLLAAASFLLGFIGLERSLRHTTSLGNSLLFWVSFSFGILWTLSLGGFFYSFGLSQAGLSNIQLRLRGCVLPTRLPFSIGCCMLSILTHLLIAESGAPCQPPAMST